MTREFEFYALRALQHSVVKIHREYKTLDLVADELMELGLDCVQLSNGNLVVYPHKSPRKNPACIEVGCLETQSTWTSSAHSRGVKSFVYEAGSFKLAGSCQ